MPVHTCAHRCAHNRIHTQPQTTNGPGIESKVQAIQSVCLRACNPGEYGFTVEFHTAARLHTEYQWDKLLSRKNKCAPNSQHFLSQEFSMNTWTLNFMTTDTDMSRAHSWTCNIHRGELVISRCCRMPYVTLKTSCKPTLSKRNHIVSIMGTMGELTVFRNLFLTPYGD